ncbi:uncharacterized protein CC84DRAFT_1238099 [Paraphaeosphaeria sporulosa]|uniref:Uncharacterized protein n=1 Tax=Paraphaeosphaeria sporulosa TaxID=1460663 RepID=A0A177CTN0_9PLEO|nr:uncharacterized protein CC84DRAFT_1238099 [Paraphaeosphaeria sporulosa]OAG10895.1 hypothetical protein CC84DRAFT_1238099 [Paraphaeosphaeria sporulosa]
MSQPGLQDPIRSIFSIIELDFGTPFTERGLPPEHLEEIFRRCLSNLQQEEKPEWVQWGADIESRNKVCFQLGRKLSQNWRSVDSQMAISTAKGMPRSIESLSPFLTCLPRIRHIQSQDSNDTWIRCGLFPWYERHCDIFTIEAPPSTLLYETIKNEMTMLRRDCIWLLYNQVSGTTGRDRPWEDIKEVILGTEKLYGLIDSDHESGIHAFVFLVYWSDSDSMARVKDPEQEIISKNYPNIRSDWWDVEVVGRLEKLKIMGASVKQSTFDFREFSQQANYPLLWPDAEIMAARQAASDAERQKSSKTKREGCKSCRLM